jgi:amino acid adenylation domain-containing protein
MEQLEMDSTQVEEMLEGVAIIGLSGRFPGAGNVDEFWRNLREGVESVKFFSDEELLAAGVSAEVLAAPNYVKASGVLEGIELFDASFFGFSPREAEIMDPQLRFFLEGSWEAMENAGYNSETYPGPIGVFGGMHMSKYLLTNLLPNRELTEAAGPLQLRIWNDKDFLASLVAYKMNLRGPSVTIQTACSTSLIAVCFACQSLVNYQCDMALAGGVTITVPHQVGSYSQEGVLSPDGHCRAFDADAQGTVGGNGMGVVLLKRLADAVADGDTIYAVLKGWAMNNDGSAKIGYTAPSVEGQMEVIGMAQALAGVEPETVTYIEAHGTGTPLGDPIEITALTEVFRGGTDRTGFCAIGSVKSNIGHLDAAAGVSSLIKTVQALRHKEIPPSINFERPNPEIDFENSPFFVNSQLTEWKRNGTPRRAGVSSFAMGGVNAHVIVEEAPEAEESSASRRDQLLVLSAKTNAALENVTKNLAAHLREQPELKLSDIAYTLQVGRKAFNHRRVLVCRDAEDAISALETLDARRVFTSISDSRQRNVVFMFPGQGTQYVQMAAGLYEDEPTFREQLDLCAEALRTHLELDLRELLYPADEKAGEAAELLNQTRYTQPALFAVEYALARVWMQWGVEPQMMIGHSVGEYVAACLAGVMTLEEALGLVAARARLMQQLPAGAMLAVSLSEEEVQPLLRQGLSLAAVNGPSMCVVSGLPEMVNALHRRLDAQGIDSRLLHTSHAFHSEMVEPILQEFTQRVKQVKLQAPNIPYVSNLTGELITDAEATDPLYWAKHLRRTVRFADGLGVVLKDTQAVLVEVGPGRALTTFCKQHAQLTDEHMVLASVRHPRETQPDMAFLLGSLGRLWLTGLPVNWNEFYALENRHRVALPTYPFERQRCWVEPPPVSVESAAQRQSDVKRLDLAEWFYTPLWKQSLLHKTEDPNVKLNWLIFVDETGLGASVTVKLKEQGHDVTLVKPGQEFNSIEAQEFTINPQQSKDYEALLSTLVTAGRQPQRILHLWSITRTSSSSDLEATRLESFEQAQMLGSHSLLRLADAVTKLEIEDKVTLIGVSNNLQAVTGDEHLSPEKATLIGVCQAIAERGSSLVCRSVDVALPAEHGQWEKLVNRLLTEFVVEATENVVAYRGNRRWVPSFEQVTLDGASEEKSRLRTGGVYFFAGDASGRALRLALTFAQQLDARIAFLLDADFPEREAWSPLLEELPEDDDSAEAIRELLELEATCSNLLLLRAERNAHSAVLENALAQTIERFGEVHGVVYTIEPAEISAGLASEAAPKAAELSFEQRLAQLLALSEVLSDKTIDFCLLQSQLSALLGETVSPSAASAYFVKSLASEQSNTGSVPWISMQWDGWPECAQATEPSGAETGAACDDGMTAAEAFQVVRRTLSTDLAHLIVSTTDLQSRIRLRTAPQELAEAESVEVAANVTLHQRLELSVSYVAPRNEDEERLALIWKQFLGFEQIGVYDNFFDLGGHSLLATQLISRVRTAFNVTLPLETLFAAPTVAGFAEQIQEARRAQEDSLQPAVIQPCPRDEALPLSFAQQRMWFFDQLESSSSTYNIPCVLRVGGALDVEALERSLNEIVSRHEILRTTYAVADEKPVQLIAPELKLAVSMIDVSDLHESEREERAQQLVMAEARQPFSLATGALLRVSLLRLKEEDHILMLTLHHILADGWSMGVLLRELEILYHANVSGKAARLPELPIQYADFAYSQRQSMQGEAYEAHLDYWKRQLANLPGALDLPTDRPRAAKQTFNGAIKTFTISAQTYHALHAVIREEGATLFMTLLAAYQTLLHRYTGQVDIVVGSAIANRNRAELEALIGFFVNTLALRTDLAGDPSFRELLRRVREVALGAYAHQDVPFEQLVEALQPVRDPSRPPLFQTMLVLQNAPLRSQELSGLTFSSVQVDREASMFDLTLYLTEMEDGLLATIEYNTDLFDEGTIERLASHFEQLLGSIAASPDERLSRLRVLTEAEERRLLTEWNDTAQDYPRDICLHELFEQQASRTPDAVALICGERHISYAELNERANQLARYLQRQGVGPETMVGLMIERSIEMVVGLLGILKAGGAYVPLDPAYPQERLTFMLEDSQARVLLTQRHLLERLTDCAAQVVCIDDDWRKIIYESGKNLASEVSSNNVAYVIYTSGSTGQPKGVMGLHRGMANRFQWMWETYPFEAGEVCCHKTSLSFLDSVWEIFGTLSQVVPVVIIPTDVVKDVDQFVRALGDEKISRIVLVPSLLRLMLDTYPDLQDRLPKLKIWVSSGEALSLDLGLRFKQSMPQSVLLNLYGSSEVSADSTWFDTSKRQLRGLVPIGHPIANTSIYILDSHLQPVPTGVPGELYIGGEGLARGYWTRASLTAEKFIPNQFSIDAGARMYATGDLARFLPDGTIEYVGRVDHQVKIRGMRLELGEIETRLSHHPLVGQVVVVARKDFNAELQLVSYVVPVAEQALEISALRQFLRQSLPEHMVPAAFVLLDEMPLTPNGKVNRRALPAPDDTARPQQETLFVMPETQTEIDLAHLWSEVLHGKEVGIDDNFFDLGGHSLLATQLISRVRTNFGVELPLGDFLAAPTIRRLADKLEEMLFLNTNSAHLEEVLGLLDRLDDDETQEMLAGHE